MAMVVNGCFWRVLKVRFGGAFRNSPAVGGSEFILYYSNNHKTQIPPQKEIGLKP